jgi:hypothetical protein
VPHIGTQEFGLGAKLLELDDEFVTFFIASSGNNDTGAFARES